MNKKSIIGINKKTLQSELEYFGIKSYKAKYIFNWLYTKNISSFNDITAISKQERETLNKHFCINTFPYKKISSSESIKYKITLSDDNNIEMVVINGRKTNTLCISSQVGCPLGCKFCETAKIGLLRNLTTEEIIAQYLIAINDGHTIDNIVFMGMGEPLLNINNVINSIKLLNDKDGINFGIRRITISTAGILPGIEKLLESGQKVHLAISLNAPTNAIRSTIMPINSQYPIKKLVSAGYNYFKKGGRRVTLEYVLIDGINDSETNAMDLAKLINKMNFHVNIIPYNETSSKFKRPSADKIHKFSKTLTSQGVNATIRYSKGSDINAACGMLANNN